MLAPRVQLLCACKVHSKSPLVFFHVDLVGCPLANATLCMAVRTCARARVSSCIWMGAHVLLRTSMHVPTRVHWPDTLVL